MHTRLTAFGGVLAERDEGLNALSWGRRDQRSSQLDATASAARTGRHSGYGEQPMAGAEAAGGMYGTVLLQPERSP
jgi:hypothetical protein